MDQAFRYCPWCAEPQRLKLVEFFWPSRQVESDRWKALRVSRYLAPVVSERHVRFSVWNEAGDRACAQAAVSLDDEEARRLAAFLWGSEARPRRRGPLEQLRGYVRPRR